MSNGEQGLSLVGLPFMEYELEKLFEVAKRTGNIAVLSREDALTEAILEEELKGCEQVSVYSFNATQKCRDALKEPFNLKGSLSEAFVETELAKFKPETQKAIQKRADSFMEDAKGLIERISAPRVTTNSDSASGRGGRGH